MLDMFTFQSYSWFLLALFRVSSPYNYKISEANWTAELVNLPNCAFGAPVLAHQSSAINWKIEIDCTLKTFSQLFQALLLPPWKQIVEDNESSDWLFGQSSSRYILPFDAVVLNKLLKKAVLRKEENHGFVRNLDFHQLHWDTGRLAVI